MLCRLFHDRVMCMHQVMGRGPQEPVSYERGRLMPLYRGATAKIILAHLPTRTLKSLFAHDAAEIAAAGLGKNFDAFRNALATLRRAGVCITHGEVDPGRTGIGRRSSTATTRCWAASASRCRARAPTRW